MLGIYKGRTIASKAQVWMVAGINPRFKVPVCYDLTGPSFSSLAAADRTLEIIKRVYQESGIIIKAIIGDMGSDNVGM